MTITDTQPASTESPAETETVNTPATPADAGADEHDGPTVVTPGTPDPTSAAQTVGELLLADPRTLVVGVNVRRDLVLGKPFLRSIADRGVREPIIARRTADGTLVVRKGKRRTVAAVEVGRDTVPVLVEPGDPDSEIEPGELDRAGKAQRVERIIDQLEENQHRAATTDADEVHAHQQLLDLGLTAGQIARRTHVPTARVKVTAAVARSELAAAVLDRYEVTLDQAAVIAEFDDHTDAGTDAVKVLTVTAAKEPAQFEHVAQKLRDERADAALLADTVRELADQGIMIVDPEQAGTARQISGLRPTAESPSGAELTGEAHRRCPGRAASVEVRRGWDREPQLRVVHWCTDPDTHQHAARWTQVTAGGASSGSPDGSSAAGMSDEDKVQRRLVIANNKAWDSATTVRRQWLRTFLARKTPPRDALVFIAVTLGRGGHDLRRAMESGHPTACEVLGHEPVGSVYTGRPHPIAEAARTASPQRATQLALAVLLGAAEDATDRQTWRSSEAGHRAYFTALREWGYPMSPVEQLVLPDPDQPGDADQNDADATGSDADEDTGDRYSDGEHGGVAPADQGTDAIRPSSGYGESTADDGSTG
ncbi:MULTISPECIES: ParB/RepB/Spo0J family partition protein [Pseudonocardia]|uniref:Uncharacterized protein n=2 Tax=Pseudonocardia TaxID=1847 RepID=A0A1Y2MJQ1_PSEAH|nr:MULTISPECIES: ParB/RepB/Spo0J family partition protein [Pseudonocardia]OSY34668.1 hypothetical protein BG845_06642 [Pseudonocardia autotrophica]TDN76441.1 ParB family chromosome partitioning protein [Pseudonocardia autotrophica]BBG00437.1 hypothetical protein Pdca_16460 [Pseudonocardia autotrophica]GEC29294.1 hypothetical protein PSA01_63230 [Pseudonocardia saturnea]